MPTWPPRSSTSTQDGRPALYGNGYHGYLAGREKAWQRWADRYAAQVEEHAKLTADLAAAQDRLITGWRPPKGTGKHSRATRAPGLVRSVIRRQETLTRHAITVPQPPLRLAFPRLARWGDGTLVTASSACLAGRLNRPVSLAVQPGTRLVISGPNGAGKSTLLALLAGQLAPTAGWVRRAPGARIALLSQESTAQEGAAARAAAVSFALLTAADAAKPLRQLSSGQLRRLDLASVLAADPHAVLLDEPTNHLSPALVDELTDALLRTDAAVIIATHDRQLLRDVKDWPRLDLA